jgi:hypothetical protein
LSFTQVQLSGKVLLSNSTPAAGASVNLTLNTPITDGTTFVAPEPLTVRCASDGTFTLTVNANDDLTTQPTGTYYSVVIGYGSQTLDSFNVVVLHADAPTVNLFTLAQLPNPSVVSPFVSQILAGTGVTLSPAGGTGAVMVTSTGGGGGTLAGDATGPAGTNVVSTVLSGKTPVSSATVTFLPLPSGVSATDTAALNAVLAQGGRIRPNPLALTASYTLSDSLVLASGGNTDIDFGGCTFILGAGVLKNMLINAAVRPTATATDAATTTGSSVVTSATLASAALAGRAIAVVGAGPAGGGVSEGGIPMYGTVLSKSGNNITVTSNNVNGIAAGATLTGATAQLFTRDANVTIGGGVWNAGTVWNTLATRQTQGVNTHLIRLRRIDGLTVRNMTVQQTSFPGGGGYCFGVNPGDCTDFLIEGITSVGCSTAVQGDGPLYRGTVNNSRGQSQDDMVAFGAVGFSGSDVEGDIVDLQVNGIQANGSWTAFKLFSGQGANGAVRVIRNTSARTIKGSTQQGVVNLADYGGVGQIDCLVQDVSAVPGSTFSSVTLGSAGAQTVALKDIKWPVNAPVASLGVVHVTAYPVNLIINNLDIRGGAGAYLGVYVAENSGVMRKLTLDGVVVPDSAITSIDIIAVGDASDTIDHIDIANVRSLAASTIVLLNTGAPGAMVTMRACRIDSSGLLYSGGSSSVTGTILTVSDSWVAGTNAVLTSHRLAVMFDRTTVNTSGPIVSAAAANAALVRVTATASLTQLGAGALVTRSATQSVSVDGSSIGVDLSILTPQDGDIAYNNNGALACGAGKAIFHTGGTGNGWKNVYSGTTY